MRLPDHQAPGFDLRACLAGAVAELLAAARRDGGALLVPPPPAEPPGPAWTHHHLEPEVFIQLSGTTAFTFPHGRLDLVAGRMLVMPTLLGHREDKLDRPGRFANLVITSREGVVGYHLCARPAAGEAPRIVQAATVATARAGLCGRLMEELVRASHAGVASAAEARDGALLLFLASIADILAGGVASGDEPDRRADRCERLLHLHLNEPDLSVAQLASWLGITPDHLARSFRRATGTTPMARLLALRLDRAQALLADGELPVAGVAAAVGFADPDYFCRVFRRRFGAPPGAWRRGQAARHRVTP